MEAVIGHDEILGLLEQAVHEDRPAHAYLFTGREGIGKKRVAIGFACRLNCPEPELDKDHSCHVCRRIVAEKHPDVIMERPVNGRIRIDRIRALQSYFKYMPVEGRYRVIIIDDAHLMNRAAQNALLKTLEEPPPARILLLISSNPARLLPTVRSRCRRIRFRPIPAPVLSEALQKQRGLAPNKAWVLAAISGGSFDRAQKMDRPSFMELRHRIIEALAEPGSSGVLGLLDLSVKISSDRDTALESIEMASSWIRDVLVEKTGAEAADMIHPDALDRSSRTAQHHANREILAIYDELVRAAELIQAEINVNRNLVTDVMLLKITRILAGPGMGFATGRQFREKRHE